LDWLISHSNGLKGTGRDAQPAAETAFNINVWRFIEIYAQDGTYLAGPACKTSPACAAIFIMDLDADFSSHCFSF